MKLLILYIIGAIAGYLFGYMLGKKKKESKELTPKEEVAQKLKKEILK